MIQLLISRKLIGRKDKLILGVIPPLSLWYRSEVGVLQIWQVPLTFGAGQGIDSNKN